MKLIERARKILWWTCAIAIGFEVCQFTAYTVMQLQLLPVMEQNMAHVMQTSSKGDNGKNGNLERFGTAMARFSMIAGIVFWAVCLLLKLGFFGFAVAYLRQPQIRMLFGPMGRTVG